MGFFKKAKKKFKKSIKRVTGSGKQAAKDLSKGNLKGAVANTIDTATGAAGAAGVGTSQALLNSFILNPVTSKINEQVAAPFSLERSKKEGFRETEGFKKPPPLVFDPSIAEAAADLATRKRQERRKFKGGTILTNRQQLGSPLAGVGLSRPKLGGIT